jgi:hypothetical protein
MTLWGEVKASSLKRADEYCRQQGKQMHQVDIQTHGVRGWTPQETFRALHVLNLPIEPQLAEGLAIEPVVLRRLLKREASDEGGRLVGPRNQSI